MTKPGAKTATVVQLISHSSEAAEPNQDEQRAAPRRRVLKGGKVAFNERHCSIPCTIRNISATGALLKSEHSVNIPDTFDLIIEIDGIEASCEVVWRRGNELGIKFLGAPIKTGHRRQQVVDPIKLNDKPSLRRRPKDT